MKAAGINVEDIGDIAGEEPSGGGEGTATHARRQATNDGEQGRLHEIQETGDAVSLYTSCTCERRAECSSFVFLQQ